MANDLLIAAVRESGLNLSDVADAAEVDPRTVQRWLGGRVPHPRYRQKLATALQVSEAELWPEALTIRRRTDLDEIAGAWAQRNDPNAVDWRALLRSAKAEIDLLGYSLSQVLQESGITKQLRAKARDGCQIRIAVADPTADQVIAADLAERPSGRLLSRVKAAYSQLLELVGERGLELRQHQAATSHTILRFDEQMLLTIHLHATPGFQAPVIHLRRERDYGIYDQLAKHFEDTWHEAKPIGPTPASDQPKQPTKKRAGDDQLDQLDYVWRPGQ